MSRRIVIEEKCEHGALAGEAEHKVCGLHYCTHDTPHSANCLGGSRTVLSEPSEEMVKRAANHVWSDGFNDENGNFAEWKPRFIRAVLDAALFSSNAGKREER